MSANGKYAEDLPLLLVNVRRRLEVLADAILRCSSAQQALATILKYAEDAGATQEDIDRQLAIATRDRPDRANALERLALLNKNNVIQGRDDGVDLDAIELEQERWDDLEPEGD